MKPSQSRKGAAALEAAAAARGVNPAGKQLYRNQPGKRTMRAALDVAADRSAFARKLLPRYVRWGPGDVVIWDLIVFSHYQAGICYAHADATVDYHVVVGIR